MRRPEPTASLRRSHFQHQRDATARWHGDGMVSILLLCVGVSALVICTPGPDTALTIRNTLSGGRRHGVLTGAGVASGQLVWTVAASVGVAGLVKASQPAFEAPGQPSELWGR